MFINKCKKAVLITMFSVVTVGISASTYASNYTSEYAPDSESEILAIFDSATDGLPEAVTTDYMGNVYTAMGSGTKVNKFTADGELLATYELPPSSQAFASGLVVDWNENIFVNLFSLDDTKGIWKITPDGSVTQFATIDPNNSGFINGMTMDYQGNLYVTDSQLQKIYKINPQGEVSDWIVDPSLAPGDGTLLGFPVGANGIAISRSQRKMYVANLEMGTIVSIRIKRDGSAGRVKIIADDPALIGVDGIAVGPRGKIYAAINVANKILRISPRNGKIKVLEEGGNLSFPSDIALGRGRNAFSVYVSNFSVVDESLPALLKIEDSRRCKGRRRHH